jgi:hypothetical protein
MIDSRSLRRSLAAAVALGVVMTLGDFVWAFFHVRHRVVTGVLHGAAMCLCMGLLVGSRARRPLAGSLAGIGIGVAAAGAFYVLAPWLRWAAMLPAWMLFWILFGVLQDRLLARAGHPAPGALVRGTLAAICSGIAFYLISGIWTHPSPGGPRYAVNLLAWSFAFLPGFAVLFSPVTERTSNQEPGT